VSDSKYIRGWEQKALRSGPTPILRRRVSADCQRALAVTLALIVCHSSSPWPLRAAFCSGSSCASHLSDRGKKIGPTERFQEKYFLKKMMVLLVALIFSADEQQAYVRPLVPGEPAKGPPVHSATQIYVGHQQGWFPLDA
jgi:hypothetical protein